MKKIIVGGTFGINPKKSSIVSKIANNLNAEIINGGSYDCLLDAATMIKDYDVVVWMPNINNIYDEIPVIKKIGAVLIVSKAIRDNTRDRGDAVARIFKYHANAVIAIHYGDKFKFTLIDALNNDWYTGYDISELNNSIDDISHWTRGAIREGTIRKKDDIDTFIAINKKISQKAIDIQGRFFGNLSTRCAALFPTKRYDNSTFLVSGRNTNKKQLSRADMVECSYNENNRISYLGERKPSVDTPIQIALYNKLPNINYMIHGHNEVLNVPTTKHYFPCGDKREVPEILELINNTTSGVINLKNHGFLIYSETLEQISKICEEVNLKEL